MPGKGLFPVNESKDEIELDTKTSLVDTWKAVIELQKTGKVPYMRNSMGPHSFPVWVKAIGVSNFTVAHIQGIIEATGVVPVRSPSPFYPLGAYPDTF